MEKEFEIDGILYKAGKLDAFKQLHLSRKVAPIIPTLIPVFMEISKKGDLTNNMDKLGTLLKPFADGLSNLSDESTEYILSTCLSVVRRQSNETWARVWDQNGKVCMFDDMDLGVMIRVCIEVMQDSLGGFIQGLLMSQQNNPATTSNQTQ